jgi:cytochrome c-type biogenesis protein CcmH/NrfF
MRRLVALISVLALAAPAASASASQRTSLTDMEDEVMCPICGTLLELSNSPQADRERVFIRRLIDEGRSKAEIKQALVRQYGRGVLAEPKGSGFDLAAWLVPGLAIALAAVVIGFAIRRWRRAGGRARPAVDVSPADAERLEADIARYDL